MFQATILSFPWLIHAFTTRLGGVSEGVFASLNLSFRVGDDPRRVLANRQRLAEALGYDPGRMVCGQQVHGVNVALVTPREAGAGALTPETALSSTDALVSDTPGLSLTAFFADCVPVVLADKKNRAIGVVHAGWRGTAQEIPGRVLAKMSEAFGTQPADCVAVLGPAIGPCCYKVDETVAAAFSRWGTAVLFFEENRWHIDLWETNRQVLIRAGIDAGNIAVVKVCTACNPELMFSYRRDGGKTGRMAAVAMIKPEGV